MNFKKSKYSDHTQACPGIESQTFTGHKMCLEIECHLITVLSCALLLVFSRLKCIISVTQSPKHTRLKRITNQFSFVYIVAKSLLRTEQRIPSPLTSSLFPFVLVSCLVLAGCFPQINSSIILSARQKLAARYLQTPSSNQHAQIYI